jgi:anti-sigma28 factor (negative regulator of flagellin synthesis)
MKDSFSDNTHSSSHLNDDQDRSNGKYRDHNKSCSDLPGNSGETRKALEIARSTPDDVRHRRVEILKHAIETGVYSVPSDKIAQKILDGIWTDFTGRS